MKSFNIFFEISCASVLLLAGFFYATNRYNKNFGLNLLGVFLFMLGVHYALLLYEEFFTNAFVEYLKSAHLYDFFLHAYISLLYLITHHAVLNHQQFDRSKWHGLLILILPLIPILFEDQLSEWNFLFDKVTWITGSILITLYNIFFLIKKKADMDPVSLKLLVHINFSYLLMISAWTGVLINRSFQFLSEEALVFVFLLIQLYLIYGLIYYTVRNPGMIFSLDYLKRVVGNGVAFSFNKEPKYVNSKLSEDEITQLSSTIENEIRKEEFFLNDQASIDHLSSRLSLSPRIVSQVINIKFNTNYSDLINEVRLEKAKELLSKYSNEDLNINQVMYQSGFSSKSNFYSYFKKRLKMTPKEYRNQILHSND